MKRVSTINHVAKLAGVTKTTVSRALRGHPGIAKDTRQRIFKAAEELQYKPSFTRQTRGPMRSGQIAFFAVSPAMPRTDEQQPGGSYLHQMIEGALSCCESLGSSLIICRATLDQVRRGELPAPFVRSHLDGVIVRGWHLDELAQWAVRNEAPIVWLDCDRSFPDQLQVRPENVQAMGMIVEHLLERRAQRAATITGDMEHLNAQERLAGLHVALARHGLALPPEAIVIERGFNEESGVRGARALLGRGVKFDALVCQNDLIAWGAIQALTQAGRRIPEDVIVTGFDSMNLPGSLRLTTIDPQPHRLGEVAAQSLMDRISGREMPYLDVRVAAKLVIHDSTGLGADAPKIGGKIEETQAQRGSEHPVNPVHPVKKTNPL